MVAVSATVVSTWVSSSPGLMPDATICPARLAASPNPKAVPLTDAIAESMMPEMSSAL